MRFWVRSVAAGAGVGAAIGCVLGGTIGRVYMHAAFRTNERAELVTTAAGATVGETTLAGTAGVYAAGLLAGLVLGLAYVAVRMLLPGSRRLRTTLYTVGAAAGAGALVVGDAKADFAFLPPGPALVLIFSGMALTALPIPAAVDRLAPDRERHPGTLAALAVGLGIALLTAFAVYQAISAIGVEKVL